MRLVPGDTVGILGGGQLGRMLALAAAPLGLKVHVFAPEADSPAFEVAGAHTIADYDDEAALARFAASVAVVTSEFENVPARTAEVLSARVPVRPNPRALAIAQERLAEKSFVAALGIATPAFAGVERGQAPGVPDEALVAAQSAAIGYPQVMKTRRLGYDGKGQVKIARAEDALPAWDRLGRVPVIIEAFVPFRAEVSIVAARGVEGTFSAYDLVENRHENHILARSTVPAGVPERARVAAEAVAAARRIADGLDYAGVFAVEFFLTDEGALLVNEIAPRVHNSGHWTIEGAETSQFEQHIRAVAGWPLGPTRLTGRGAVMENLIGDAVATWPDRLAAGWHLHLYGKAEARAGRKMGHVTRVER